MNKESLVYWLVHDANLFENHPELIHSTKVVSSKLDQRKISFGQNSVSSKWPDDVIIYIDGSSPVDYMLCNKRINLISERAKLVIENIADKDIEYLPVQILQADGQIYNKMRYWAINILTVINAIDWQNTRWSTPRPPNQNDPLAVLKVILPCLNANIIGNANIFHIEIGGKIRSSTFISLLIKQELEKSGCIIGMEFEPIETI
jgi:hypothetical protein